MEFEIQNALRDQLSKDEKFYWVGKPQPGLKFRPYDLYLIPFSIMWCGFAIFWESTAVSANTPFFFKLWGIPFVVVGLYFTFGRFVFDILQRSKTLYAITDNRVIIKSGIIRQSVKSLNIRSISDITFHEKSDGSGSITLGPAYSNSPFFTFTNSWQNTKVVPTLEFIDDVRNVYNIILSRQKN